MRTLKLLLFGVLSLTASNIKSDIMRKENTLSRISESIVAHTRLITGLNALAILVKPSNSEEEHDLAVHDTISMFFNFNESVIDGLLKVDGIHAERVVNAIHEMKRVSNIHTEIEGIEKLGDINEQLGVLSPLSEEMRMKEMISIVEELTKFEKIGLSNLDYSDLEKSSAIVLQSTTGTSTTSPSETSLAGTVNEAKNSLENFQKEVYVITNKLKHLHTVYGFVEVFGPLKKRIDIYETIPDKLADDATVKSIEESLKASSTLLTAAEVAHSLRALSNSIHDKDSADRVWTRIFPEIFSDLNLLNDDFQNTEFVKALNENSNITLLKTIIEPVFKPAKDVESYWKNIEMIIVNTDLKGNIEGIDTLLSFMIQARTSEPDFSNSWNHVKKLFTKTQIPPDVAKFSMQYNNITQGLQEGKEFAEQLKSFLNSEDYSKIHALSGVISEVRNIKTTEQFNQIRPQLNETVKVLKGVKEKLGNLSCLTEKIQLLLKETSWDQADAAVKWAKTVFEPFHKNMNEGIKEITCVTAGFNFAAHQDRFSPTEYSTFRTHITELEKVVENLKNGIVSIREELTKKADPSSVDEPYYKNLIILNDGYSELKEKLISGSILFHMFHRLVTENSFNDLFKRAEDLHKNIMNLTMNDTNRFDFIQKMNKFKIVRSRIEELKSQIMLRKDRYDDKPMEELLELRWLIENLHDVTNPAFRKEEWKSLTNLTDLQKESTDFKNALDKTFDLDFAAHQEKVIGTFAKYRGLVRYNQLIFDIERIKARTFWESHHHLIDIFVFVGASIIFNIILYVIAVFKMRRDEKRDEEKEKEKQRMYYLFRIEQIGKEEEKEHAD